MTRAFALTIIIIIAVITLQEVCANKGSWWSRWVRSPHTIVTPKDSSNNHGDSSFPQLHSDAAKQLVPWNNLGLPVDDSIDLGIMRIDKRQLGQTFLNLSERIAYLIISTLFARLAVSIIASAVKKLAEKVINELPKDKQIYSHNATSFLKPNSTLNEEEKELLNSITLPEDIKDDWKLIGGLQSVKQGLWDTVQFEMKNISLLASTSSFQRTSKSVLIHGPPGCGKTAIVRGLSKKLGWPLLSIRPSSIMRKYWGESESLVRAIFDLAKKSEHIVIFVDEIESLITSRDNLSTNGNSRILTECKYIKL